MRPRSSVLSYSADFRRKNENASQLEHEREGHKDQWLKEITRGPQIKFNLGRKYGCNSFASREILTYSADKR